MTHKRNRKPYLITSEVAVILKCSVDEVRRLETDGEIVAVRTRGRHRHFDPASVEALSAPPHGAASEVNPWEDRTRPAGAATPSSWGTDAF